MKPPKSDFDRSVFYEVVRGNTEEFLEALDCYGPNFEETPDRVARAWLNLLDVPFPELNCFPLEEGQDGSLIKIRNHVTWGFCPHHILPVRYVISAGYVPSTKVLGLSKLARLADYFAAQFPLQEDLAEMIAQPLIEKLEPQGVMIIVNGEHACMQMRGVESLNCEAVSSYVYGLFKDDARARAEFLQL